MNKPVQRDHNQIEAKVRLNLNPTPKKATSKKASTTSHTASASAKNGRKLKPNKDIATETSRSARGSEGGPSLFSVWSGDALSLFMFNVSPLILQLNFKIRQTLSEAQKAESQCQIASANESAVLRQNQGQADKEKMSYEAAAQFASAGMSFFGAAQCFGETLGTNGIMEDELATQDRMLSDLLSSKAPEEVEPQAHADIVEHADDAPREAQTEVRRTTERTEEELEAVKSKAKRAARKFKEYQEKALEELRLEEPSKFQKFRDDLGGSRWFGAEKPPEQVENERALELSRRASKEASKRIQEDDDFKEIMQGIKNEPEIAESFVSELGSVEEALNSLRGMPSDERGEILKGFGKSDAGKAFRAELKNLRLHVTAHQASFERNMLQHGFTKRQLLAQIVQGFASGAAQTQGASSTIDAANADAQAKIQDSIASTMSMVRGAQDGVIQGALSQVEGLAQWYNQMESQVIGAVSQSLA